MAGRRKSRSMWGFLVGCAVASLTGCTVGKAPQPKETSPSKGPCTTSCAELRGLCKGGEAEACDTTCVEAVSLGHTWGWKCIKVAKNCTDALLCPGGLT